MDLKEQLATWASYRPRTDGDSTMVIAAQQSIQAEVVKLDLLKAFTSSGVCRMPTGDVF